MTQTTPTRDEAVPALSEIPASVVVAMSKRLGAVEPFNDLSDDDIAAMFRDGLAAYLASAPAPASGGVDAVAWRTVSDFVDEMLRDWPGGDDCRMGFGLNGATVTKGQFRAVQAALASLPPAASALAKAASSPAGGDVATGLRAEIAHDGFTGDIIGRYVTREGKRGAVVQQDGTRVVHVYGEKWLPVETQIALSRSTSGGRVGG